MAAYLKSERQLPAFRFITNRKPGEKSVNTLMLNMLSCCLFPSPVVDAATFDTTPHFRARAARFPFRHFRTCIPFCCGI